MKKNNFLTYLTFMVLACSCTIMGRPGLMVAYKFEMGYDNLQKETDKFVEENPNINRYYNEDGFGYDTGEYREYEIICKKDTLLASVYFIDRPDLYKDSLRRIGVLFLGFIMFLLMEVIIRLIERTRSCITLVKSVLRLYL